jgi:DNA-binding beta-propeller fold protein YncE
MIPRWSLVWVGLFLLAGSIAWSADQASVLRLVADVPLPGPAVRFDYQSVDTLSNRLYIAHMNAGQVVVFDLAERRVVKTIGDLPRVTGVCAVPALGKVYASAAGEHHVAVIDARSLQVVARVGDIDFPDGIAYAPEVNKIYVSDESGKKEVVIDGATDRVVVTIPPRATCSSPFRPATRSSRSIRPKTKSSVGTRSVGPTIRTE